jgi:signal transduction histidine kinase
MAAPERESARSEAELDLLQRRVVNVVGHELRTPVTTLRGLAEELLDCHDPELRQELTVAMARNARRLDRLVEDLLLAAGVNTLIPPGPPEQVDLAAAVRSTWAHDGRDVAALDVDGRAVAAARSAAVHRILSALLDNSIVHGEPPIQIRVSSGGDRALVEIASGGPELPPGDLALACEPFYRGERAVTTTAGLGVGLPLARTLARAEGGDVTIRTGDGGGLVACLDLPAA